MPAKMQMIISNGGFRSIKPFTQTTSTNLAKTTTTSQLTSSMISRIHNVKPGCGSCGR